jgi:hypothetical protein
MIIIALPQRDFDSTEVVVPPNLGASQITSWGQAPGNSSYQVMQIDTVDKS